MRRAATAVEMLVVVGLSVLVLGALFALWRGGTRMARAAEGSGLLTAAMLLEEALTADVRQLGIDPQRRDTFLVGDTAFSFYRVRFEGEDVRLRPVRWARVPRAGGGFALVRTERGADGKLAARPAAAALSRLRFSLLGDATFGNRYLRVDFAVRDADRPEESAHALVLRVPAPSGLGNPSLALAMRVVPEAELLPLEN